MKKAVSLHHVSPAGTMSLAGAAGVHPVEGPKRWYIATVTHNTEKSCCRKLLEQYASEGHTYPDFETYVPLRRELRVWRNGRRKHVDRILLPTYIFIRCTETVRKKLKEESPFIKSFLKDRAGHTDKFGISPFAYVPDSQMHSFQRMVGDAENPVTIDPCRLHVGTKVRVKGGSLTGLEGHVLHEPGGRTSIVLCIDFLGCAKTEVPLELLETV